MRVVFSQRLSEGFKIVPEISILFLIILSVQPQSVLGNSVISPFFCLSAIFIGHFIVKVISMLYTNYFRHYFRYTYWREFRVHSDIISYSFCYFILAEKNLLLKPFT